VPPSPTMAHTHGRPLKKSAKTTHKCLQTNSTSPPPINKQKQNQLMAIVAGLNVQ